jgi:hypothetical protein
MLEVLLISLPHRQLVDFADSAAMKPCAAMHMKVAA